MKFNLISIRKDYFKQERLLQGLLQGPILKLWENSFRADLLQMETTFLAQIGAYLLQIGTQQTLKSRKSHGKNKDSLF